MFETPILVLIFNRPEATRRVYEALKELQPTRLFIAADGARPHKIGEAKQCSEARAVFQQIDWVCESFYLYRDQNLGCRNAVFEAITWFFEHIEEGIILEDDCVPDPSFFPFCSSLLAHYRTDPQVRHIAGYNPLHEIPQLGSSYFFNNIPLVWGWATWRRAWQQFDLSMSDYPTFKHQKALQKHIPSHVARVYLFEKLDATYQRQNDSWAYAWTFCNLLNQGLCVVPRVNLIQNVGFGKQATNTGIQGNEQHILNHAQSIALPLVHPSIKKIDPYWNMQLFYASQKKQHLLWLRAWMPQTILKSLQYLFKKG